MTASTTFHALDHRSRSRLELATLGAAITMGRPGWLISMSVPAFITIAPGKPFPASTDTGASRGTVREGWLLQCSGRWRGEGTTLARLMATLAQVHAGQSHGIKPDMGCDNQGRSLPVCCIHLGLISSGQTGRSGIDTVVPTAFAMILSGATWTPSLLLLSLPVPFWQRLFWRPALVQVPQP